MDELFKNEDTGFLKNEFPVKPFPYIKFGIGAALAIFLLYQVAGGGAIALLKGSGFKNQLAWAQGLVQVLAMLLPTLWIARRSPLGFKKTLRLERPPSPRQWIFGLLGIIAVQLFAQGFDTLQERMLPENILEFYRTLEKEFEELYRALLGSETVGGLLRALLIGAAIPAITEEFLFRGVMQRSLEEAMPFKKAIILTGLIFGAIHFNLPVLIPLIIIGMYLGVLAYYSQSILLPLAAHFLNNAVSILGLYRESDIVPEISVAHAINLLLLGGAGIAVCIRQVAKPSKAPF